MINLGSILKRKAITLLMKFHIAKAVFFQVLMYECESWIIKNRLEQINLNCGAEEDS